VVFIERYLHKEIKYHRKKQVNDKQVLICNAAEFIQAEAALLICLHQQPKKVFADCLP
jgi:hypothetical protein